MSTHEETVDRAPRRKPAPKPVAGAARPARSALLAATAIAALTFIACQPLGSGASPTAATPPGSPGSPGSPGAPESPAAGSPAATGGGAVTQLTIATGGTGGVYYPLGGGMAEVIRDNVPGYDATVQETNASVDNMQLIAAGGADIAFSLGDTAADAVTGAADFEGSPVSACALGRLYNNATQVVTTSASGITTIAGLSNRRVSLGSPGSGTEIIALRMLEAAGIDPDAGIDRQQLGIEETVAALRDGTIDAGFWSGGLPTSALVDYATSGDMVLIPTGEFAEDMSGQYGEFYVEDTIPAGSYEGQDEDVSTVSVPNVLVVNTNMAEDLQRQITEAVYEHKDDLVAVHPAAEELDPATGGDIPFMDVCPGAQAYFDTK